MRRKKKKVKLFGFKDKYARRRTALAAGLLLFLLLILKLIFGFSLVDKANSKISFLLNNEKTELKKEMILDDNGVFYLSKEDIENIFDKTLYYNEAEKELITTYNKHIALLKVDEKFMLVNDSNVELKSPMIEKGKTIYIPVSEMGIVYDLEFEYSAEDKRLIADSISKEKRRALALKKFKLKERPGIFSKKTEKIEHGEYLVIVEEVGKYYKVRSSNGNLGYVKKNKLSDPEKLRDNWDNEEIDANVLKEASSITKDYSKVKLDSNKTNVVIPTFFYIDKGSYGPQILDKTNSKTDDFTKYMKWVKENDIEVWATLSNNIEVSNSLRTYSGRNKIINELYYILVEYEFKGVNINFEKIDDVNSFNRFVIELTPRLKELGLRVSVTENKNVDTEKLKDVVDIIIK